MFDLTFLGTSASVPSAHRNHPGLLVEAGGHREQGALAASTEADEGWPGVRDGSRFGAICPQIIGLAPPLAATTSARS
jgi:hypothetical protein